MKTSPVFSGLKVDLKNIMIKNYISQHIEAVYHLAENCVDDIQAIADEIIGCFQSGGKLLICGNGGSAADAQHISTEMVCRFIRNRIALPAIALTCDSSILTAVPNDFGYEQVFARQVEALGNSGDILLAISTSGTSPSIIRAAERAKSQHMKVITMTGLPDSKLQYYADRSFCSHVGVTSITQEIHQIVYHLVCDLVEREFTDE